MIDYLKIHNLPLQAGKILNNDLLTFPLSNVATTGEIMNRSQVAHWQELRFVVKNEKVSLKGSLHKHFEGGTNYRNFHLTDIQATVKKLAETFQFDPQRAFINFIEVGVNISLPDDPNKIIKTLVNYRNKPFTPLHVNGKGYGRQCETQRFTIKIYNKSLQYDLPGNLLRFEVKILRMKYLQAYGIYGLSLADLTDPDIYPALQKMLLDVLDGILLYDPGIKPDDISIQKDRELFIEGRYADFWQDMDRFKRQRKIKRFSELAGSEKIKSDIAELIKEKCYKLTALPAIDQHKKMLQINSFAKTAENGKMLHINTTIKGYFEPTCTVTNLPLKNQRMTAKYLSAKGIKWYYENDPDTYREKLETLLTKKWKKRHANDPLEAWFFEIYHQIRNRANNPRNNPRNNTKRSYRNIQGKGLKLWPLETTADPAKLALIAN